MTLSAIHQQHGATLANDGIPLHYGDLAAEYAAGLNAAILLDRSHEGRISLTGADRYTLLNRMSTNKIADMRTGEGCSTIFTSPNARILDRAHVYNRADDLLVITEPGRGGALHDFLKRHVFFNDKVQLQTITPETVQLALHGVHADAIMEALAAGITALPALHGQTLTLDAATFFAARRKPLVGSHWMLIAPLESAAQLYEHVLAVGKAHGLIPAGSLTYHALRVRAGYPAGRELSSDYLPLEAGLWDDISFHKGCYTGQEIIARMDSRERIARTLVAINSEAYIEAPAEVYLDGKLVGELTSSARTPDGQHYTLAIIKVAAAQPGTRLTLGSNHMPAEVAGLPGAQPPFLVFNQSERTVS